MHSQNKRVSRSKPKPSSYGQRPPIGPIAKKWIEQGHCINMFNEKVMNDPTKFIKLWDSTPNTENSTIIICGEDLQFDARVTPYHVQTRLFLVDFVCKGTNERYREMTGMSVCSLGESGESHPREMATLTKMFRYQGRNTDFECGNDLRDQESGREHS